MKVILRLLATLLTGLVLGPTAHAEEVRLPRAGTPALTFQVPDDWTVGDERGRWIVNIVNALPASVAFSITITADARSPSAFIVQEMTSAGGSVPIHVGKIRIAGLDGELFESAGAASSREPLQMKYLVARVGGGYLLAVTQMTGPSATAADLAAAESLIGSIRVSAAETSSPTDGELLRQMRCPESYTNSEQYIWDLAAFLGAAKRNHPDWTREQLADFRFEGLRLHRCAAAPKGANQPKVQS